MTSCSTHSRLQLRRSLPISWHSESKIQRTKERENPSQSNFQNKHCRVPTIYEYSERTRLCQDIWRFIFPWQYAATTWQIILTHHHFWQAPLRARSTERGHQSPEWMVLAKSTASSILRSLDFRSCWMVFIHVIRGRPSGFLQFPVGEAVKICL